MYCVINNKQHFWVAFDKIILQFIFLERNTNLLYGGHHLSREMITEVLCYVCSCSQQANDNKETPGLSS